MALSKIFTSRYYIQNAGFFFLLFYFFVGIVPGGQLLSYHYTLLTGIVRNVDFLLIAMGLWLLYNLKCMAFVQQTLSAKENLFLYGTLGVLDGRRKWITFYRVHFSLYTPVFIYCLLAILIAFKLHFYIAGISILLFNVLMTVLPLLSYDHYMRNPGMTSFFARWQEWANRRFGKPVWSVYLYELVNNHAKSLAVTKAIGVAILLATFSLMGKDYDIRFIAVGLLINLLAHSLLVFNNRRFDDLYLSTLPQLPIPLWKRYAYIGLTYLVLLLPEYVLLLPKTDLPGFALLLTMGVSVLLLLRAMLYFPRLDQDKYYRWVFIVIIGVLFLSLAYLYWYAVIILQLLAFSIFCYRYYRYEAPLQEIQ
jgi:hypothetical protein